MGAYAVAVASRWTGVRREGLSWRGLAAVALLCLLLSTQVLFQPAVLEAESPGILALGWLEAFAESFLCGASMWLLVTLTATTAHARSRWRVPVAVAALVSGALLGSLLAMLLLQPPGFYPGALLFLGDALRWAIYGAVVFFAQEHLRAAARDAAALDAASVARESLQRQAIEAQLEVLRAQIEPHFLFNTLAHVKRLYAVRPEAGAEMLSSLRRYLEISLPGMRERSSTVSREIEFVRAYLQIVRIRLGPRLSYAIEVPQRLRAHPLPPMMLITLVENAVKHGIAPREEGGAIAVRARADATCLEIDVADTGAGFQASEGSGVGLANLRARLHALYGDGARLVLFPNDPRGVVSRMRIPLAPADAVVEQGA